MRASGICQAPKTKGTSSPCLKNQVFPRESEPYKGVWDQFLRRAGALQGPPTSPNLTSGSSGEVRYKDWSPSASSPIFVVLNAWGGPEAHKWGQGTQKVQCSTP